MFDSPLTLTGMIATLLSVVFAVAAWMNTRRRRQAIAQQAITASVDVENRTGSSKIDFQGSPANKQAVFKKVGPNGQPTEPLQPTSEHVYAWE